MGVNTSYWLIYGVDINEEYYKCEQEIANFYETFEENGMIASYHSDPKDLENKNTILFGEDHTIYGRVLLFFREEDGFYSLKMNTHVIPVSSFAAEIKKKINEDIFLSIRKDLKTYFDIDDKIPEYLIINNFS